MTYIVIDEHKPEGKKLVAFLKTQPYIEILDVPNTLTNKVIKDVQASKVKIAKNPKNLFQQGLPISFAATPDVTALAGIWKDKEITLESLRENAWGSRL